MYPNSKHVEEAEYMSAYCAYLNSPEPELDQEYTYKAINKFQLFINKYPNSKHIPDCNKYLDKLRKKLEDKAYLNAKLYFNLGDYKAAVVVLENTLNKYPDTSYREELMFLNIKAHFKLAENSITEKQAKRYQDTIDAYYSFIDEFPNSKFMKEAQKMYENSVKKIKKV
jgi:outer membrane protein assembly factor BamD